MNRLIRALRDSITTSNAAPDYRSLLDFPELSQRLMARQHEYISGAPFPHIVIDNFLPQETVRMLLEQYPLDQGRPEWVDSPVAIDRVQSKKRRISDPFAMPKIYRELLWELSAQRFLNLLTKVSGIRHLLPDPSLEGAGIHQISRGGFLKVHADFSTHLKYGLSRRINLLLYLNSNWQEEWGGHLELWDPAMQGPPVRILPTLNRCVIFNTTATSYHGHPHPLMCPPGIYRKSIALYYYSNGRPEGEAEPTVETTWKELPEAF